jgi:hypothetical protein
MLNPNKLSNISVRAALLVAVFFCLAFLFVSPAVRYAQDSGARDADYRKQAQGQQGKQLNNTSSNALKTEDLIRVEFQKAIDEIKLRLEEQNSWYHYKFLLIGGIFALFLGHSAVLMGGVSPASVKPAGKNFADVITSTSNYSILALTVVIAFALDMHIRNNMFGNQTIGLWIANYVEPSYPYDPGFFPWETFLRKANNPRIPFDSAYKLGFSVQLHFMTIAAYLVYTIVFHQVCINVSKQPTKTQHEMIVKNQIVIFGFVLVHLAVFAFVFVTRAVPGTYEMNLIPLSRFANGWTTIVYYMLPLVCLLLLNMPFVRLLRARPRNTPRND